MIQKSASTVKRAGAVSVGLLIALGALSALLGHNHGSTGKLFPRMHAAHKARVHARIQVRQAARRPAVAIRVGTAAPSVPYETKQAPKK